VTVARLFHFTHCAKKQIINNDKTICQKQNLKKMLSNKAGARRVDGIFFERRMATTLSIIANLGRQVIVDVSHVKVI